MRSICECKEALSMKIWEWYSVSLTYFFILSDDFILDTEIRRQAHAGYRPGKEPPPARPSSEATTQGTGYVAGSLFVYIRAGHSWAR